MSEPPVVAVTVGDPAGIGPEVVVKALDAWMRAGEAPVRWWVFGPWPLLQETARQLGVEIPWIASSEAPGPHPVTVMPGPAPAVPMGRVSREAGEAAYRYLEMAAHRALAGEAKALVTAPVNKAALSLAGVKEPGHTEILARLLKGGPVAMMLTGGGLRVAHATTHVSLARAIRILTPERVAEVGLLTRSMLRRWGMAEPRIAVAGLNPHNGEDGLFGDEEARIMAPAVALLQAEGVAAEGPVPADTVFWLHRQGRFDAVVALYHDQGHIPVKLLAFEAAVNLTLGLPVPRTSPDHGTGFDIAGQGVARPTSMLHAMRLAVELAHGA